ncbi:hypothetical protein ACHAQD_000132 [Fusarium lateritium]
MSDESLSDSDIDVIDLNSDEEGQAIHDHQDFGTPVPQEIILGVNGQGSPIPHMVDGPQRADSMDIDDAEAEDDELLANNEESLFVDNDGYYSDSGDVPSSPPNDDDNDEDVAPIQPNQPGVNMGNPGGDDDPGDDSGDDPDDDISDDGSEAEANPDQDNHPINDPDVEGDALHGHKTVLADVSKCLEEERVNAPEFYGNCLETCYPPWWKLAQTLRDIRTLFLEERQTLARCKATNRARVTDRNRTIRELREQNLAYLEVVQAFYRANAENTRINQDLHEENEALRGLVSEEDLGDFPDAIDLPLSDMEAAVSQETRDLLPANLRNYVRISRRKPRKTKRVWPKVYRRWIRSGRYRGYNDWGDIYKLSCTEENMSSAFGKGKPPNTHPLLRLCRPTDEEEAKAIGGEGECCTPPPYRRCLSLPAEPDFQPFRFNDLPDDIQVKILRIVLVFDGEPVHAVSRLDPYYEPDSDHLNCNQQTSLLHRFHIGREQVSLTFGTIHPQKLLAPLLRLTYEIDQKHKYTSRRTDDLAPLTEARRLKSIAVYLPESSKQYMRRRHEPPHIVAHMADKTELQPNFRKARALRTLQGVDYFYCLRGVHEITFWDYDKYRTTGQKVPVRDWTFVRDINESVRREKVREDAHFSELRYLAPFNGLRPSTNLARILEAVVNPPPEPTGLLSPPPESENMYPHPQSPVSLTSDAEDQSEEESGGDVDDDQGDSDPDDDPDQDYDDGGGGGGDSAVGADHDNRSRSANSHSPEPHENDDGQEEEYILRLLGESRNDPEEHKYEPGSSNEVWSDNGATYNLSSDDEDEDDESQAADGDNEESGAVDGDNEDDTPGAVDGENEDGTSEAIDVENEDGTSEAIDVENEDAISEPIDVGQAAMPPPPAPIQDRSSEDAQGQQHGERERSGSLFVRSPDRERQSEFVTKVETPTPPPPQSPARSVADSLRSSSRAVHDEATPVRQTREESDLFVSPTPYDNIVPQPQAGDRASPIDLTEDLDVTTSARASHSSSPGQGRGQGQGQNKRPWADITSDSGEEDDCVLLGRSPKRPRGPDNGSGGIGIGRGLF